MTAILASTLVFLSLASPPEGESNWPGWRGPNANGHSAEKDLPVKWSPDSIAWKTPLRGWGQSSPVIWGDKILLTTALENGRQRVVFCVDRNNGKILWEKVAWTGEPEKSHKMNGWASATCVTDGERVYAFFGRGGLHCYTLDGENVWSKNLGPFESPWGTAACPVLVGDLLIQNCDADADAQLYAFDKKTGTIKWKVKREDHRGWSTPVVVNGELVLNGHTGVTAYEVKTGKKLWHCNSARGRGTPTVTPGNDLIYVINGLSGNGFYAIKPGGSGDVTGSHRVWLTPRKGRDTPSPVVIGNTVLIHSLKPNVTTAYDGTTGKALWTAKSTGQVSATPVAYNGLAFFIQESGETFVVDPEKKKIVAWNKVVEPSEKEIFRASITPSDGQVFIRSNRMLYCVGKRKSAR